MIFSVLSLPALGSVSAFNTPGTNMYEKLDMSNGMTYIDVVDHNKVQARAWVFQSELDSITFVTVVQLQRTSSWKTETYKQKIFSDGIDVCKTKAMGAGYSPHPLNDGNGYPDFTGDKIDDASAADGVLVNDNWKYADWIVKKKEDDTKLKSRWDGGDWAETDNFQGAYIGTAHYGSGGSDGITIDIYKWHISNGWGWNEQDKYVGEQVTIYPNV